MRFDVVVAKRHSRWRDLDWLRCQTPVIAQARSAKRMVPLLIAFARISWFQGIRRMIGVGVKGKVSHGSSQ